MWFRPRDRRDGGLRQSHVSGAGVSCAVPYSLHAANRVGGIGRSRGRAVHQIQSLLSNYGNSTRYRLQAGNEACTAVRCRLCSTFVRAPGVEASEKSPPCSFILSPWLPAQYPLLSPPSQLARTRVLSQLPPRPRAALHAYRHSFITRRPSSRPSRRSTTSDPPRASER